MSNTNKKTVSDASFPGLAVSGLLFVALKLCGVIHWSWWWVTLPFWGIPALVLGLFGIFALVMGAWLLYYLFMGRKK